MARHAETTRAAALALCRGLPSPLVVVTLEALLPGLRRRRESYENREALGERLRRMALFLETAAVLELQARDASRAPEARCSANAPKRCRRKAARIGKGWPQSA